MGESEDTLASMPVQTVVEEGGNHVETEGTHDGLDDEFCGKVLIDVLLAHQEEVRKSSMPSFSRFRVLLR
jgi:hypothetical protein